MAIKPLKRATEESLKNGWTTNFKLLQEIQNDIYANYEWSVDVEEVEMFVLTLEKLGYVKFEKR